MALQKMHPDRPKEGKRGEAPTLHAPPPKKPVPPGHLKQSGKTVPAPKKQSTPYGRKGGLEKVGLPGHGGTFPALPPRPNQEV